MVKKRQSSALIRVSQLYIFYDEVSEIAYVINYKSLKAFLLERKNIQTFMGMINTVYVTQSVFCMEVNVQ